MEKRTAGRPLIFNLFVNLIFNRNISLCLIDIFIFYVFIPVFKRLVRYLSIPCPFTYCRKL